MIDTASISCTGGGGSRIGSFTIRWIPPAQGGRSFGLVSKPNLCSTGWATSTDIRRQTSPTGQGSRRSRSGYSMLRRTYGGSGGHRRQAVSSTRRSSVGSPTGMVCSSAMTFSQDAQSGCGMSGSTPIVPRRAGSSPFRSTGVRVGTPTGSCCGLVSRELRPIRVTCERRADQRCERLHCGRDCGLVEASISDDQSPAPRRSDAEG